MAARSSLASTSFGAHAVRPDFYRTDDFMVAPEVRSSGLSPCATGALQLYVVALTSVLAMSATSSADFERFPGEKPSAAESKEWLRKSRPLLSDDEVALINGLEPSSLLGYSLLSVPPALVANDATGVTAAMVEQRAVVRLQRQDDNTSRTEVRDAKKAELQHGLFKRLEKSMMDSAPLLLAKLKREHAMAGPRAHLVNGVDAWAAVAVMEGADQMLPGEAQDHDAALIALALKPLANEATPQEYADRVNAALKDHIPYLDRPFRDLTAQGVWVLEQLPEAHAVEGRVEYARLTAAQRGDPHQVAAAMVVMMAKAAVPGSLRRGALREFIGVASEEAGRRPRGLPGGRGKGDGKGRGGGGRGNGDGRGGRGGGGIGGSGGSGKPTGCSTPPPRGPTCKYAHNGPCWRDNLWPGPLPARVAKDPQTVAAIEADRTANAVKFGEAVVPLAPPTEGINVALEDNVLPPNFTWSDQEQYEAVLSNAPAPAQAPASPVYGRAFTVGSSRGIARCGTPKTCKPRVVISIWSSYTRQCVGLHTRTARYAPRHNTTPRLPSRRSFGPLSAS